MKVAPGREVLVHCWRGGMRSASVAWLLETAGIKSYTLVRGYQSWRREMLENFWTKRELYLIGGETGSGKTEVLKELKNAGEQVVDLEELAHHKGSSFGAIGEEMQPSVQQFENDLFDWWLTLDSSRRIWIEDESRNIGRVFIPYPLWHKMKCSPIFRVSVPLEIRVKNLVRLYGKASKNLLFEATNRIGKRLGGLIHGKVLEAIEREDLELAANLLLKYYDEAYDFNHKKTGFQNVCFIKNKSFNPAGIAAELINYVNNPENRPIRTGYGKNPAHSI